MAKNPHIFLTRSKQHTQEINRHFDRNLNHYGPMFLEENQEQNESYIFKDMFLQPDKSDLIIAIVKEVEAHSSRSN